MYLGHKRGKNQQKKVKFEKKWGIVVWSGEKCVTLRQISF